MTSEKSPIGPPQLKNLVDEIPPDMWTEWISAGGDAVWSFAYEAWRRRVTCRCGNWDALEIRYADGLQPDWISGEYGGTLRAEIACPKCRYEFLLFDDGLHGYNAVVCNDRAHLPANYAASNRKLLERRACPCGGKSFAIIAEAMYDCGDENGDTEEQRNEAYGCFRAISRCSHCREIREVFVAETA